MLDSISSFTLPPRCTKQSIPFLQVRLPLLLLIFLRKSLACFFPISFSRRLTANYSPSWMSAYLFLACCTSGWGCKFLQAGICLTYVFWKNVGWVRLIFHVRRAERKKRAVGKGEKRGGETKAAGMRGRKDKWKQSLKSGNRERANMFEEKATLASAVWFDKCEQAHTNVKKHYIWQCVNVQGSTLLLLPMLGFCIRDIPSDPLLSRAGLWEYILEVDRTGSR